MNSRLDDEKFEKLVNALGPYRDRVVIVGGWAHRLFRSHPLAQPVPYLPLMTRDTDVAIPVGMTAEQTSLRERLLEAGFTERFVGDDHPPATHYQLEDDDAGFYAEFLTPLAGGALRRNGARDVTTSVSGVTAQKLRHLDLLLIAPWTVTVDVGGVLASLLIPNAVSYIIQKLLIANKRKPGERAKDLLYIHDTLELFAGALTALNQLWTSSLRPELGRRTQAGIREAVRQVSAGVTDETREAARMVPGRVSADRIVEVCRYGLDLTLR